MQSTRLRPFCVALGVVALVLGYLEWIQGDWRQVIGQVALLLLAVVLWFALPPGASKLQAPTAGTRGMRIALYTVLLIAALIACASWPAGLDDSRGSDSAVILFFAVWVTMPLLRAERRDGETP